jgi:hypothetical protein
MKKQILFLGIVLFTSFNFIHAAASAAAPQKSKAEFCADGYDALFNQFDFHKAEIIFTALVNRYALDDSMRADAELGLAWTYHQLGHFEGRDPHMSNVKKLLQLPNEMQDYTKNFNPLASSYYSLEGYRQYIYYEKAFYTQNDEDQKKHLLQAKEYFLKAEEITRSFGDQADLADQATSLQGLGTIYEFLAKYVNQKNWHEYDHHKIDTVEFMSSLALISEYRSKSTEYFQKALNIRKQYYGKTSAPVARSHHKLGRSYLLADNNDKAKFHYETAIALYKELNIPNTNAKVAELTNEYTEHFTSIN